MTRNEIIRLSTEAGFNGADHHAIASMLLKFAELVAQAEREACAKMAAAISDKYAFGYYGNEVDTADEIAKAIRARSAA